MRGRHSGGVSLPDATRRGADSKKVYPSSNPMKSILSLFALTALIIAFSPLPAQAEEGHAMHVLKGYLNVANALYEDDLAAAKKAAASITDHDADSTLAEPATKVADAENLATAREAFKALSAKAIELAKGHGDHYTVMHCPMVKGGGGDWLSADGKVNNPYFGPKMPHCGGPKK